MKPDKGTLVLEDGEKAERRGARPLAWLRGVGMSCDAFHETAPDPSGLERAMRDAHRRAGVRPAEIDLLMAHGTGTALNDLNEMLAFRSVFGARAGAVMISAIKSMTGHTSGASGLMGVITAIECTRESRVPPTVGLDAAMPEAEGLDSVFKEAGFEWRRAGCSMCLGMNPDVLQPGERCASTSNRNFEGRQGRGGRTHLVSPAMAAAAALEGHFVDIREYALEPVA